MTVCESRGWWSSLLREGAGARAIRFSRRRVNQTVEDRDVLPLETVTGVAL
ncbi:MAG: hypothetical protein WCH04_20505 [Gammaproteobacteria bacterium]